jgi:hypothetical protein
MVTYVALETFYLLNNSFRSILAIAPYKEFIGNSNSVTDENKVNKVGDKFRSEYGAEIYCFLF